MASISSRHDDSSTEEVFIELFREMIHKLGKLTDKLEEVDVNLLDLLDHMEQMHMKINTQKPEEEWIVL